MERATYRPLAFRPLQGDTCCRQPSSFHPVRTDTPAIAVMTDFQSTSPVQIRADATLAQAHTLMVARSVRLLLVTEADGTIVGVITARDAAGERPIKLLNERGGKHGDLRVGDVMTRREQMEALPYAEVLRAEVGHILATLKQVGRQHALVVETDPLSGADYVRGMFSATHIGRRMGVPVMNFEVANTFAEIEAALAPS